MRRQKRAREWTTKQVTDLVRGRILSAIHSGHVDAGDRLATYREVADETGLDLRGVARVYRRLEEEGLVEVRGRQGVFVAAQERIGRKVLEETARWIVGVLRDAWTRRIHLPDFPEFARNCVSATEVRCACIESTEDQLHTICAELRQDFGFRTLPRHAERLVPIQFGDALHERVPPELKEADLVVTTAFHAAAVGRIADALQKPLVVIRLDPDIVRELERHLGVGDLTVICVDPRFLERIRLVVGPGLAERVRGVLADDEQAIRRLDRSRPVLISHAARERLGKIDLHSLFPGNAVLSAESAEELAEILVRFNLDAMKHDS